MSRIIQIERWGRDGIVALFDDGQLWIRPFERGWEKLQGPPVESKAQSVTALEARLLPDCHHKTCRSLDLERCGYVK